MDVRLDIYVPQMPSAKKKSDGQKFTQRQCPILVSHQPATAITCSARKRGKAMHHSSRTDSRPCRRTNTPVVIASICMVTRVKYSC